MWHYGVDVPTRICSIFAPDCSGSYGDDANGGTVTESSPTCDPEKNPRAARLIRAEEACLKHGGCCLRLAGLYSLERGAHNYWLTSGKDVTGRPDGIINLKRYLRKCHEGRSLLGCDNATVFG
jgi:hypothetical protein